jgi:hypothetical protein
MAEPAHRNADGPAAPETRRPDPRASGWAAARQAMIIAAESNALAVRQALARPGDAGTLELARLSISLLEALGGTLRELSFDAEVFAAQYDAGWRARDEACKACRCRLQVVDGGR